MANGETRSRKDEMEMMKARTLRVAFVGKNSGVNVGFPFTLRAFHPLAAAG